jgi:hypothetical protein
MAMVQCQNGHHYDDRKHTHCPYCPAPGLKSVRIPRTASEYKPVTMVQCQNGHHYDDRKYTHCPYCPVPGLPRTASKYKPVTMVQCQNGHHYDDRKHTHCPHCPIDELDGVKRPSEGIKFELVDSFRFSHEPRGFHSANSPLLGRKSLVDRLAARIVRSDGGSFLLVGYRGVGKTSVVNAIADAVALKMRAGQDGRERQLSSACHLL